MLSSPAVIVLAGLIGLMAGCADRQLAANKAIVLANAHAYNEHDVDALRATIASDLQRRCQATPGISVVSADDFIAFAEADWATFPDGTLEIERLVAEGDRVGVFGRFTGTQRGPMGTFPASDKRVDLDFGAVFSIDDGRIVRIEVTWDNLAALTQLGHWPLPAYGQ